MAGDTGSTDNTFNWLTRSAVEEEGEMIHCPMCGHVCYRTPERPDWSCPYHGRVNLLQAKMDKQAIETESDYLDESISWEVWKNRFETVDRMYQTKVQELTDLQTIFRDFIDGIEKLGIS